MAPFLANQTSVSCMYTHGYQTKQAFSWPVTTTLSVSQMIDGEAFLLLTQTDIVKIMSIKLGPALKISNAILMFKSTDEGLK